MANRKTVPSKMLFRNQDGKVVEIPSDRYVPSTKALPDVVFGDDPLSVRFLNDPAKTRAMEIARAKYGMTNSLAQMGASNPRTPFSDDDFLRLLAFQKPLDRPRTQAEIDEEQRLKDQLAASTAEMQLQPQGFKAYPGEQKLTTERILQMYPPTKDVEAQVRQTQQTPEYRTAENELAAERSRSIQRALEVAKQKRQMDLEGAYGRGNAMLSPENEWMASAAASPQNVMLSTPPRTGPLARAEELEDNPELTGSTASGALAQGSAPSQGGSTESATNAGGLSLPLMARTGAGNDLGFRGGAFTPGTSLDRSSALNRPFNFSTLSAAPAQALPKPWSSSARTEGERPASASAVRREPMDLTSNVRSAPTQEAPSFLSRLFSGTNNPVSTRELFNRSEANPDDSGAYMRAERQYAATHKDAPSVDLSKLDPDTGMNRGGIAKAGNTGGGKDAALHKALEIIHHLLTRGR